MSKYLNMEITFTNHIVNDEANWENNCAPPPKKNVGIESIHISFQPGETLEKTREFKKLIKYINQLMDKAKEVYGN